QRFKRPAFVDFNNPDFVKYAESFGTNGIRIESRDELAPALRGALNSDQPGFIDCPVHAAENPRPPQQPGVFAAPTDFES
ncbi:MAG: thiamine pyrophosphate-dependent enzyme, partial [Desulfobacterales bacterium]|nr:thiamine pyrophosphate-dependent enzyme [Desulfobacterales bacterium]